MISVLAVTAVASLSAVVAHVAVGRKIRAVTRENPAESLDGARA